MSSESLKELITIIKKDSIQSTYKLALIRGLVEVVRDRTDPILQKNGQPLHPLTPLLKRIIIYYYPLLSYSFFIPQSKGELLIDEKMKVLVIRKAMEPIILYYEEHGGYTAFVSDIENDNIPLEIILDYKNLIEKMAKVIIDQPMKYLGSSIYSNYYSVVRYEKSLEFQTEGSNHIINDDMGFFSIEPKYREIIENKKYVPELLDIINQRWVDFTLTLLQPDELSRDTLFELLQRYTSKIENDEISYNHKKTHEDISFNLSELYNLFHFGRTDQSNTLSLLQTIFQSRSISSLIDIEKAIQEDYSQYMSIVDKLLYLKQEIMNNNHHIQNTCDDIKKIGRLFDISTTVDDPQGIIDALSSYYSDQHVVAEKFNNIKEQIERKNKNITALKNEEELIRRNIEKVAEDVKRKKQLELSLITVKKEINNIRERINITNPPFGYVDKPITRFLTYCEVVTRDVVRQSIQLYLDISEGNISRQKIDLPLWFINGFHIWWDKKKSSTQEIKTPPSSTYYHHPKKPYLFFNVRESEILIYIPPQKFDYYEEQPDVKLVIVDENRILIEEKCPLYLDSGLLWTEESTYRIEHPSTFYQLELFIDGKPTHSPEKLNAFMNDQIYLLFDYDSGKQILYDGVPSKRFILVTKYERDILPSDAVIESGQLAGEWYEYQYIVIDPTEVRELSISNISESLDKRSMRTSRIDFYVDHNIYAKDFLLNGNNVILGHPPTVRIRNCDNRSFDELKISIHPDPHIWCSIQKTKFVPLGEIPVFTVNNPDDRSCSFDVDLGDDALLGKEPIGIYVVRFRNYRIHTDFIMRCAFLPGFFYQFSNALYVPEMPISPSVHLRIESDRDIFFEPHDPTISVERLNEGLLLVTDPIPKIQGTLRYQIDEDNSLTGKITFLVPLLAWRFENKTTDTVWSIHRDVYILSEHEYESLGRNITVSVYLPYWYNGQGKLQLSTGEQSTDAPINNGRGVFSLDRFSDTVSMTDAREVLFHFSLKTEHGDEIFCPLFKIERWYVELSKSPEIYLDSSGNRVLSIEWVEYGDATNRGVILWKNGSMESDNPIVHEEEYIASDKRSLNIIKSQNELSPGQYKLYFYKMTDEWDPKPIPFGIKNALNVFPINIDQESEILNNIVDADIDLINPDPADQIVEISIENIIEKIEMGDINESTSALDYLKDNYTPHQLDCLDRDINERLQRALIDVISDPYVSENIKKTAIYLIGRHHNKEMEQALIRIFDSHGETNDIRLQALKALGSCTSQEFLDSLYNSSNDPDQKIRIEVAKILGRINNNSAIPHLLLLTNDGTPEVQEAAIASLEYYTMVNEVINTLMSIAVDKSRDTNVRIKTILVFLNKFSLPQDHIKKIVDLSQNDADDEVRQVAQEVLMRRESIDPKERKLHLNALITETKSSNLQKRMIAIKQLSFYDEEEVIQTLSEFIDDPIDEIRKEVVESLIKMNSFKSIPILIRLLEDPDIDIQNSSNYACMRLRDQLISEFKMTVDRRDIAAAYISKLGIFAVESLIQILRDAEKYRAKSSPYEIRMSAVKALSQIQDPRVIDYLVRALNDQDDEVVASIAQVFGSIGNADTIQHLENVMEKNEILLKKDYTKKYVVKELDKAIDKLKEKYS